MINHAGMELVHLEYTGSPSGMVLRIFIDKPGGVTIDDCAHISRIIGDLLDVKDPIPEHYTLEVSSPGINRPLVKTEDFDRFTGERVFIKTREPVQGRKRFKGILKGIERDIIKIDLDDGEYEIPLDLIARARLDII